MAYAGKQVVRARPPETYISRPLRWQVPHSCARARTVASEVFTEAQSFADCKLHIRTRLLASAFSNFWTTLHFLVISYFFLQRKVELESQDHHS